MMVLQLVGGGQPRRAAGSKWGWELFFFLLLFRDAFDPSGCILVVDGDCYYCSREVLLPATAWLGSLAALAD